MRRNRNSAKPVLCSLIVLLLAGCKEGSSTNQPEKGDTAPKSPEPTQLITQRGFVVAVHDDFSVTVNIRGKEERIVLAGISPDPSFVYIRNNKKVTVLSEVKDKLPPQSEVQVELVTGKTSPEAYRYGYITYSIDDHFGKTIDLNEYLVYLGYARVNPDTAFVESRLTELKSTEAYAKGQPRGIWE